MAEKFDKGDSFLRSLSKEQRERYDTINLSIARAAAEENFRETLLTEFGASSLRELAKAAKWAVKNDVSFSEMMPKI